MPSNSGPYRLMILLILTSPFLVGFTSGVVDSETNRILNFRVSDESIRRMPRWASNQENPPVSASAAVRAANNFLKTHFSNHAKWKIKGLALTIWPTLSGAEFWIYEIKFIRPVAPERIPGAVLEIPTMVIPVTMDGKVPFEKITAISGMGVK